MKVLLTGATGFIGKELSEKLLTEGHSLTILVRKVVNIEKRYPYPAEFVEWDHISEPPQQAIDNAVKRRT